METDNRHQNFKQLTIYTHHNKTYINKLLIFLLITFLLLTGISEVYAQKKLPKFPQTSLSSNNDDDEPEDTTTIHIINADVLEFEKLEDKEVKKLLGNVEVKQKDATLWCDSAHFYFTESQIKAYQNVHIKQGDSIDIYADRLVYDGIKRKALLYDNVKLDDKESYIESNFLVYDLNTRKAILNGDVHLTDKETDVYSDSLEYFVPTKEAYLYDNVRLTDGKTETTADFIKYQAIEEKAYLKGDVHLSDKKHDAYADSVYYDIQGEKLICLTM